MSRSRRALGEAGEGIAAAYLEAKGYRILAQNDRPDRGELDIVAMDGETVVFVEVRTRRTVAFGTPLESVDRRKQLRLIRLARAYLAKHGLGERSCRFDVIGVSWSRPGERPRIDHIESAFTS